MCTPTTLSLGKDTIGNFQSSYSANTNLEIQAPLTSTTCEACDFCIWIMLSLKPVLIANCFVMPLAWLLRSNTNLCQIQCLSHLIFVAMLSLEPNRTPYWIRFVWWCSPWNLIYWETAPIAPWLYHRHISVVLPMHEKIQRAHKNITSRHIFNWLNQYKFLW